MIPFKKILVPVDFGPASNEALKTAIELAKHDGAELVLVHVWEIPMYSYPAMTYVAADLLGPVRDAARAQLAETLESVRKEVPGATGTLQHGLPWQEVLATIERTQPDLVVMGTHGRKGVRRMFLGSVAEKIVRASPAPVLTMHGPPEVRE
jgi:nucleotide-binding universal stress UspA family protein